MLQSSSNGKIEAEKGGWETSRGEQIAWVRGALRSRGKRKGWEVALVRSLVMYGLWEMSGRVGTDWLHALPWLLWWLNGERRAGVRLRRILWEVQRGVMLMYIGLIGAQWVEGASWLGLGLGCVICGGEENRVKVEKQADGSCQATLCGHFTLQVSGDTAFRVRLLMIFLGLLQTENDQRRSRRTRDGRTPFVRQEQMAAWFGETQEVISRYMRYWLEGNWGKLLSLHTPQVLTAELVDQIVSVCASFPQWGNEQVYHYLHQQGVAVTHKQVEQAAEQSGWGQLQKTLRARFEPQGMGLQLREKWLVEQLLSQIQALLLRLEAGLGLAQEEHFHIATLQAMAAQAGAQAACPLPIQPWMQKVEQVVFQTWDAPLEEAVCCTYCGSADVSPKSKQPRQKKFIAADGQMQSVDVYRYYCRNPRCTKKSFTHLPDGLLPYSPYRTQFHLLTLQMYAWGYSTYRRTGSAMGLCSATAWRWVHAWGHSLLPVAALFGMVRSSGVVGVDEKYVLVPKNDKPDEGKMRRWMYVYLAVDVWSYDLLHIAIYPHNNHDSALAFLLALRSKGYHPTVIITDLRGDYGTAIASVYPQAVHHKCIFHALKNIHKLIKDVYDSTAHDDHSDAVILRSAIDFIFDTDDPHAAQLRFDAVGALRHAFVHRSPLSADIFDFLERHWPKLSNSIGHDLIPATNNHTELVIRRFDQHYQNFCGFDSIESAHTYLGVFEKLYRFTPFSLDAQPRIRGKSPLQLAGYDTSQLPFTAICSGLSIDWPTEEPCLVPNL